MFDLIVVGGGAAGFFTAIRLAEERPQSKILILEKSNKVLSKVKVSGGGRCNVTHACFIPKEMVENYPRGSKELLGPYHQFLCGDMMAWLSDHGVETKMEDDGRVFPVSDSSQTIIDCFMNCCEKYEIKRKVSEGVSAIVPDGENWKVKGRESEYRAKKLMVATGSTPSVWEMLQKELNYQVVDPVPSLFTFNIKNKLLEDIPGLSMPNAEVTIHGTKFSASGPVLITHWGLSGPGILRLSAWAARELHSTDYRFQILINWIDKSDSQAREALNAYRIEHGKRIVTKYPLFGIPRRFWERFCYMSRLRDSNFASLTAIQMDALIQLLCACPLNVNGKSTFKEEFVTCGGVERKQIDFKSMQSKLHSGLYMAGEVIDIDAITGGFNFQAAWTEAYLAAAHMSKSLA